MPKKCEDCHQKWASCGLPNTTKRRWCGPCAKHHRGVWIGQQHGLCEDRKDKWANYGRADTTKRRWCFTPQLRRPRRLDTCFRKTFPICISYSSSFSTFLILQNFCKMVFYWLMCLKKVQDAGGPPRDPRQTIRHAPGGCMAPAALMMTEDLPARSDDRLLRASCCQNASRSLTAGLAGALAAFKL